jgi:uncharacterized protein (TIGR00369 family)
MPDFTDAYDAELGQAMLDMGNRVTGVPDYLGIRLVDIGPGWIAAEMEVRPELLNPFGAMHGAALSALVDHVLGSAVFPLVPRGTWPATLEFKLNYLAPVRAGIVRAESRVIALRARTAVVRVDVTNEGQLVGTALGTISLNPPKTVASNPAPTS